MMYIKYLIVILSISFLLISCVENNKVQLVKTEGKKLLVNNMQYQIKGVCYHPVPKGSNKRSFENLDTDIALMLEAGINTVRVYEPIDDSNVLNKFEQAGIKIIIGFGYNQNGNFDILSGSFINYVNKYKNHKAILFWELGNEYNYHPEWFENDITNWYKALNKAAELIHLNDKKHPVATAHGELPDTIALQLSPSIDVWGINVYRWDNPASIFNEWEAVSSKPMYLSEAGADSFMTATKNNYKQGINEKAQADATKNILNTVLKNDQNCLGVTIFSFVDELWKAGNYSKQDIGGWAPNSSGVPYDGTPNEEYWGIVNIDRSKKQVFEIIKEAYNKN